MPLTRSERRLKAETYEILSYLGLVLEEIEEYPEEDRATRLIIIKQNTIRGEIVMKFTVVDEYLTLIICHFYFRRPKSKSAGYSNLWKNPKFKIFNHYLMDEIYTSLKVKLIHEIDPIPSAIRVKIEKVTALRNAITHSLFAENRRQYAKYKKVMYDNQEIFSMAGLSAFENDFAAIRDYLEARAWPSKS